MALSPSGSSTRVCDEVNDAIQTVKCLVDGCAEDLSGCRKYYKLHNVCEIHSNSPQVSINGQNLRFCQQCSRFHLLEEFDEGKHSCRKRLDGHNRRRRKPRSYLSPPSFGTNMLQYADQQVQVHPTVAPANPRSGVVEAPAWMDHSNCAPSLLSSSVAPTQTSISALSNVVQPSYNSGSVFITAGSLDQGPSYGGLENDCDASWRGMTDVDPQDPASFIHEDLQTLPYYWQS